MVPVPSISNVWKALAEKSFGILSNGHSPAIGYRWNFYYEVGKSHVSTRAFISFSLVSLFLLKKKKRKIKKVFSELN